MGSGAGVDGAGVSGAGVSGAGMTQTATDGGSSFRQFVWSCCV